MAKGVWIAVGVAGVGCARVQERAFVETVPVRKVVSTKALKGSHKLELDAKVRGTSLDLVLSEGWQCSVVTARIGRKVGHTERSVAPGSYGPGWPLATAVVIAGIGAYMIADAERLAAESAASSPEDPTTAQDFQTLGGITIAGGAVVAGIALVDAIRLRDSTKDLGEVTLASDSREKECHHRAIADQPIRVKFRGSEVASRTDAAGRASISMLGVAEADLPSSTREVFVHVGDGRVPLELSGEAIDQLLVALEEAPGSRLRRDRAEEAQLTCKRLFASLTSARVDGSTGGEELARLDADWGRMRSECGASWGREHETASVQYQEASRAARRAIAERACKEELARARALLESDLEGAEDALGVARQSCSFSGARANDVLAVENALIGRVNAERVRQETASIRGEILAAVGEGDLVLARGLARANPAAAKSLDQEPSFESLLFTALDVAFREALAGQRAAAGRLCHGRKLFMQVYGQGRWRRIVRALARGDDPVEAARRVKVLKSGGCR